MKTVTFKECPYTAVDKEQIQLQKKPVYECIKRMSDIVCSLIALIILSPVMLITMIAIYIDDLGAVIFKQIRMGKDGREFMIYKFRSMKINAEDLKEELINRNQSEGANFKMRHNLRRTRVGKFICKTSIDELPQLVNILKGDMSIIALRPFIPEEQAILPSDRLLVKPGLSCYWQIGGKNTLSVQEQIALDRKYVADIKIIIKTFFVIFNKENK